LNEYLDYNPLTVLILALMKRYVLELAKLDAFLKTSLDASQESRLFLDGDRMTLADCNILPKLQVALVAGKKLHDFDLPNVSGCFATRQ